MEVNFRQKIRQRNANEKTSRHRKPAAASPLPMTKPLAVSS